MPTIATRAQHLVFALALTCPFWGDVALAAQSQPGGVPAARPLPKAAPAQAPPASLVPMAVDEARDARETRDKLQDLLQKHPPALGRVLKLDTSLLNSPEYLAAYPALAVFLAQHPEVARSPDFFLSNVYLNMDDRPRDARGQVMDMWRNLMEGVAVFCMTTLVIGALMWLIRTLIDYRRWSRLSKTQHEVHNKLLDRFASNDDLMAYIRTPAGSRFLESAPIALETEPRGYTAPLRRILWSMQAGLVLAAGGLGLFYVSGRVAEDVSSPLWAIGALAVALGVGFVGSAAFSYLLSRRLGLISEPGNAPAQGNGTQA